MIFKNKWTKWMPLGNFTFAEQDFIVFVRKNLKTGMLKFETLKVNNRELIFNDCVHSIIPNNLIDTKTAWDKIINEK